VALKDQLNANNLKFQSVAHNSLSPRSYDNSIDPKSSYYTSGQQRTNDPKPFGEHNVVLTSKLEEILASPYLQPVVLDEKLRSLFQCVMKGSESEAFVDDCLKKTRVMSAQMDSMDT